MIKIRCFAFLLLLLFVFSAASLALSEENRDLPRVAAFSVCTQNLFRYGEKKGKQANTQRDYLIERMLKARCDVIAVQELYGKDQKSAKRTLTSFRKALEKASGDDYDVFVGDGFDPYIRNGYLYKVRSARHLFSRSIHDDSLPKLQPIGPNEKHLRDPVLLVLGFLLEGDSGTTPVTLMLLNFHLKSKHKGFQDYSGTDFETTRMESAEGLRDTLINESVKIGKKFPQTEVLPVLLGDRNNNHNSATAAIMRGDMILGDFMRGGICRLDSSNDPVCSAPSLGADTRFLGLLELWNRQNQGYPLYTYEYHHKREVIDDILVLSSKIDFFSEEGRPRVGVTGKFYQGSDHRLVWTQIRNKQMVAPAL